MGARGGDAATVTNWLGDLTFAEAHALTYGVVHGTALAVSVVLAFQAGVPLAREVAIGLALVCAVLNGWLSTSKTEGFPIVAAIIEALPRGITGQIRAELHYYDGGFIVAFVVAFACIQATLLYVLLAAA